MISFILLCSCGEDLGGTRQIALSQEEAPQNESSFTVRCFSDSTGDYLRYLINARDNEFDYQDCSTLIPCDEEERNVVIPFLRGSGNETRPCLKENDSDFDFEMCISTSDTTPDNPNLVNMVGYIESVTFDFYCEESINDILR